MAAPTALMKRKGSEPLSQPQLPAPLGKGSYAIHKKATHFPYCGDYNVRNDNQWQVAPMEYFRTELLPGVFLSHLRSDKFKTAA